MHGDVQKHRTPKRTSNYSGPATAAASPRVVLPERGATAGPYVEGPEAKLAIFAVLSTFSSFFAGRGPVGAWVSLFDVLCVCVCVCVCNRCGSVSYGLIRFRIHLRFVFECFGRSTVGALGFPLILRLLKFYFQSLYVLYVLYICFPFIDILLYLICYGDLAVRYTCVSIGVRRLLYIIRVVYLLLKRIESMPWNVSKKLNVDDPVVNIPPVIWIKFAHLSPCIGLILHSPVLLSRHVTFNFDPFHSYDLF